MLFYIDCYIIFYLVLIKLIRLILIIKGQRKPSKLRQEPDEDSCRFEYLQNDSSIKLPSLKINDLKASSYDFKFTSFILDNSVLNKFLLKCKLVNSKLTGCMNVIAALAISQLCKRHKHDELSSKICFHLLANLQPFLNINHLNPGYWAVVMNSIIEFEGINFDEDDTSKLRNRFWQLAKTESDSIHERIDAKELFENAKGESFLLDIILNGDKFENGGGAHFALSNLGALQHTKLNLFRQREVYFCTSLVKDRWNALIFHGLSSIDGHLCWGIVYTCEFISDAIIDEYLELIEKIVIIVTQDD